MRTIILKQEKWETRTYHLLREERNQFNGLKNENHVEALIDVEPLSSSANKEKLFRIKIKHYKQSNVKGMYKWVRLLHPLKENLVIGTDDNGMIAQVKNIDQVREQWDKIKNRIYEEQKKETNYDLAMMKGIRKIVNDAQHFARNLKFTYPYLYLFPPLYNKTLSDTEKTLGYRELPHLLNVKEVPIITNEYIKEYINEHNLEQNKIIIEAKGEIDKDNFEQDKLTELIKIVKNRPRVPTIAKLNYMERYLYSSKGQLSQGMCISLFEVTGSIYREEKTLLRQV
jgi:hypothetical protein